MELGRGVIRCIFQEVRVSSGEDMSRRGHRDQVTEMVTSKPRCEGSKGMSLTEIQGGGLV